MNIEFRKADLPADLRRLVAFDHKVFPKSDWFPPSYWKQCESYWLLLDGLPVGCTAFDRSHDDNGPLQPGSLYIATTGILPKFHRLGLGRLMKAWQIAFAKHNRCTRVITTTRRRNKAMIALNKSAGFRVTAQIPRYYADPEDSALVMELRLKRHI